MLQHMFYSFLGSLIKLSRLLYLPFSPQGYEANCFPLLADALRLRAHFRGKLASEEGSFWGQLVSLSQDEVAGSRWGGMTPSLAMIFCIYARNPGEKGLTRANHPLPHKAWYKLLCSFLPSCEFLLFLCKAFQLGAYPALKTLAR